MPASERAWERLLATTTKEVQDAVSAVATGPERGADVGTRGAAGDRTLVADKLAEEVLAKALLRVKDVRVLSEEAGDLGDRRCPTLAVVDPLDGSSNFERGIQFYCTSVAIAEGGKLEGIRIATIRNLVNGDLYFAAKGKGAKKNGKRITLPSRGMPKEKAATTTTTTTTTKTTEPNTALAEAVLAVDQSGCSGSLLSALAPLVSRARRVVHFGANALELCLLAEGTIDSFVDLRGRMRITDIAGGYLIAKEAGAEVAVSCWPEPAPRTELSLGPRFSMVASANQSIHKTVIGELRKANIMLQDR